MNEFQRGLEERRRVLGEAWVTQSLATADALNAEWQTFLTRHAWTDVWGRQHASAFDERTRRLLVLAMTLALGRDEEFMLHARAALSCNDGGKLSLDDLRELIIQAAVYCGVPAANHAMQLLRRVLQDQALEPPQLAVSVQGEIHPERPVVVFSHALGYDQSMWTKLIAVLPPTSTFITYDHRGHGRSARTRSDFSIDALVDDAAALILNQVFAKGGGPVHFVGLSLGGMVAQGLAARYPHLVRSIVVANSAMRFDQAARALWQTRIDTVAREGMTAIVETTLSRWFGEAFRAAHPELMAEVRSILLGNDTNDYVRCCAAIARIDFSRTNPLIRCPTLVIAGTRDPSTPPELSRTIAQSIPGARLVELEAAHLSALECAEAFATELQKFWQA